jgi:hypothetical protein
MKEHRDYRQLANMLREKYPEYIAMTDIPHEAYMAAQAIDELMDYIDSIKTPPAQPAPVQEPVAWVNHGENRITRATGWDGYGALYTTPQAQPAPAPGYCKHCKQYTIEEPLTAAQPAPVPLTDEQIWEAIRPLCNTDQVCSALVDTSMDEYRAIEAKLREKNGGAA